MVYRALVAVDRAARLAVPPDTRLADGATNPRLGQRVGADASLRAGLARLARRGEDAVDIRVGEHEVVETDLVDCAREEVVDFAEPVLVMDVDVRGGSGDRVPPGAHGVVGGGRAREDPILVEAVVVAGISCPHDVHVLVEREHVWDNAVVPRAVAVLGRPGVPVQAVARGVVVLATCAAGRAASAIQTAVDNRNRRPGGVQEEALTIVTDQPVQPQ